MGGNRNDCTLCNNHKIYSARPALAGDCRFDYNLRFDLFLVSAIKNSTGIGRNPSGKTQTQNQEELIKESVDEIAKRNFPERFETRFRFGDWGVSLDIATAQYHLCQIRIHNKSSTKTADNVRVELIALEDAAEGPADDYFRPKFPIILKPEIVGENTINPGASQKYNLFRSQWM